MGTLRRIPYVATFLVIASFLPGYAATATKKSAPAPSLGLDSMMEVPSSKKSPSLRAPVLGVMPRADLLRAVHGELVQTADHTRLRHEHENQVKIQFESAQAALTQILKARHQTAEDYPLLKKHLFRHSTEGDALNTPFARLIVQAFTGSKTFDEYAYALIRLGTGAINLIPAPPEVDVKASTALEDTSRRDLREEFCLFAGDCYLFAGQYLEGYLTTLLKDLQFLPEHRKHAGESGYLTTVAGRRLALDCAGSTALLYQWALIRLDKEDTRRSSILDTLRTFSKNFEGYYKAHGTTTPSTGEILHTTPLIPLYAKNLTLADKFPVTPDDLKGELFQTATDMVTDLLRFKSKPTLYHIRGQATPLMPKDFATMLRYLLKLHITEFNLITSPELQSSYARIKGIVKDTLTAG